MTCLSSSCVFCANECAPAHCVCVGAAAGGFCLLFLYLCVICVFVMGMVLPTGHLNAPLQPGASLLFILLLHSLCTSIWWTCIQSHQLSSSSCFVISIYSLYLEIAFLQRCSWLYTRTRRAPLFSSWIQMSLMLCCLLLTAFLSTLTNFRSLLYSDYIRPEIFHHSHSNCVIDFLAQKKKTRCMKTHLYYIKSLCLRHTSLFLLIRACYTTIAAIAAAAILVLGFWLLGSLFDLLIPLWALSLSLSALYFFTFSQFASFFVVCFCVFYRFCRKAGLSHKCKKLHTSEF